MQIEYDLNEDDYMTYARYHFRRSDDARSSARRISIFALVGVVIFALANKDDPQYGIQNPSMFLFRLGQMFFLFGVGMVAYMGIIRPYVMRGWLKSGMRKVLGATQLELKKDGVAVTNPEGSGWLKWNECKGVVDDAQHIFILMGPLRAFVVPKRAFADPAAAKDFFAKADDLYRKALPANTDKV